MTVVHSVTIVVTSKKDQNQKIKRATFMEKHTILENQLIIARFIKIAKLDVTAKKNLLTSKLI